MKTLAHQEFGWIRRRIEGDVPIQCLALIFSFRCLHSFWHALPSYNSCHHPQPKSFCTTTSPFPYLQHYRNIRGSRPHPVTSYTLTPAEWFLLLSSIWRIGSQVIIPAIYLSTILACNSFPLQYLQGCTKHVS